MIQKHPTQCKNFPENKGKHFRQSDNFSDSLKSFHTICKDYRQPGNLIDNLKLSRQSGKLTDNYESFKKPGKFPVRHYGKFRQSGNFPGNMEQIQTIGKLSR